MEDIRRLIFTELLKKLHALYANPKVHYHDHNILPQIPILSHMNPIHTVQYYSFKINFNIILECTPRSTW
jgi:hypothetical protein